MDNSTLLKKVQKVPVPEPGTGEVVILPSVEALCTWMKLNNLKVDGWHGSLLMVRPDVNVENEPEKDVKHVD